MDMRPKADSVEGLVATIVVTFQMMSTFLPLEGYLAPQITPPPGMQVAAPAVFPSATLTLVLSILCLGYFALRDLDGVMAAARRCWPLMLFCGYTFVSVLWSIDSGVSFNRCGRLLVVVCYPIYLTVRFSNGELMRILTRCFAIWAICTVGVVLLRPDLGMSRLNGYVDAWRGASNHKNYLGMTASVATIVMADIWRRRAVNRWLSAALTLASLAILVNSRSATGIVAAAICLAWMVLSVVGNPLDRAIVVLTAASGIIAILLLGQVVDLFALVGRNSNFTGRSDIWAAVWDALASHIVLGYGYGFWATWGYERRVIDAVAGQTVPHSHNGWLDVWMQLGLPGLAIAILLFVYASRLAYLAGRGPLSTAAVLPSLLVLNVAARSVSETVLTDPNIASMFWFALAFAMLAAQSSTIPSRSALAAAPRTRAGRVLPGSRAAA